MVQNFYYSMYQKVKKFMNLKEIPEFKSKIIIHLVTNVDVEIINKYSSLIKLKKIMAYCLRFINNCKSVEELKITGNITAKEIQSAKKILIKLVQQKEFGKDIKYLMKRKAIRHKSKLLSIFRCWWHIRKCKQIFHMIKNNLSDLIVYYKRLKQLHAETQLTSTIIRTKYGDKNYQCAKVITNIMGNLRTNRIQYSMPFTNTGVDYCGPFILYHRRGGVINTIKSNVAVFICFVTKAKHLELISDLSIANFLAALKRFMARRLRCLISTRIM